MDKLASTSMLGSVQRSDWLDDTNLSRCYLIWHCTAAEQSIGIETVKLVIEPEASAATKARELIDLARLEIADELTQQELLQLIETIIVYKFPQKSREEIEQMLGLSELKQTRVYQEAKLEGKLEGKLEAVPFMLSLGASVEQIAEALGLDIQQVRQVAQSSQSSQEQG